MLYFSSERQRSLDLRIRGSSTNSQEGPCISLFHIPSRLEGCNHPNLNRPVLIWPLAVEKLSPSHSDRLNGIG